eukprot:2120255-Pyramimonas_sp.AAC.1
MSRGAWKAWKAWHFLHTARGAQGVVPHRGLYPSQGRGVRQAWHFLHTTGGAQEVAPGARQILARAKVILFPSAIVIIIATVIAAA